MGAATQDAPSPSWVLPILQHAVTSITLTLSILCATSLAADSYLNFESGHVRPLALSPAKDLLFAVNTPDNRLEVLRVTDGGLERAGEVRVGLEPVAVAAQSQSQVYVVNHLSDSVSCVDVSDPAEPRVTATLLVGDEPRDVVVAGTGKDRLYVTTAHRGQNHPLDPQFFTPGVGRADVWVFDTSDLSKAPEIVTLFCDTPRALAVSPSGDRVYAAAFHSGNQTTTLNSLATFPQFDSFVGDGFSGLGMPEPTANIEGTPAPETGLVVRFDGEKWRDGAGRDWSPRIRFNLPDRDVFVLDATQDPPVEVASIAHVGTIIFNLAVHPLSGDIYASNIDSQNHVRFEPEINGHVAENRVTIIQGTSASPVHLNPHIDYSQTSGSAEEIDASLAFPLGMEFSADGETLFVAAFGSGAVGVLDAAATVQERIQVGGGPSGLALDEARDRLYVMNRFDHTISIVDLTSRIQTQVVPLAYTPEPQVVLAGRPLLYDARNSGHGDSACASCHIFGDFDSLTWDLGDPNGLVEPNPLEMIVTIARDFHPMKGPMATQSLRGIADTGPMHWRGDRNAVSSGAGLNVFDEKLAFMAFRPAFQTLLGKSTELSSTDMERFSDFALTIVYPPNPIAAFNDVLSADEAAGKQVFDSDGDRSGTGGDGIPCAGCHELPFGTDGRATNDAETQDFKVAHLRNMYQKVGMFGYAVPSVISDSPLTFESTPVPHFGDQVRGTGYLHDGSIPTLLNFFRTSLPQIQPFTFRDEPGRTGEQKVRELSTFMLAFDTGLAPVVGQQITLDSASNAAALDRWALFEDRADAGRCDLIAHGRVGGEARSYLYQGSGSYQSDRRDEVITSTALQNGLASGNRLTFTAVYLGGGTRMGLDRDEDGWFDGDEIAAGTSPTDPSEFPRPAPPTGLEATPDIGRVELSWSAAGASVPAVTGYNVYRSTTSGEQGEQLNSEVISVTEFVDTGVPTGEYHYSVTSTGEGGESEPTPQVTVFVPHFDETFLRANCNGDASLDIADPVFSLNFLFADERAPPCAPACDSNSDGSHDVSDAVFTLLFLFAEGEPPLGWPECETIDFPCEDVLCTSG